MTGTSDRRFALARMEVAQAETQRHLGVIERQIAARAERLTITDRAKRRQHGRSASSWTNADERLFQQHFAEVALARRGEIDALTRKLDRQETAIAEFSKPQSRFRFGPGRHHAPHHCEGKRSDLTRAGGVVCRTACCAPPGFGGGWPFAVTPSVCAAV